MARHDEMLSELAASAAIPGVMGVGPGKTYDAVVAAHAPDLTGDTVTFFALEDRTLVVVEDVPDGSITPIAEAIEHMVAPPYRAAAGRTDGDAWAAVAESVRVVELPDVDGDEVDLSIVDGDRTLTIDGEPAAASVTALDALAVEHDSVALHAERIDGDFFAVDVFPL